MKNQYLLSEDEDPKLLGDLTAGTSQQAAPVPAQTPPPTMAPPPATPTPAPAAPAPAAPMKLPGMPATMTADELTPYLNRQKAQLSRFGPDEQLALQNRLNQRQNSLGYKATEGLKGFADALMMGVARAGNPNWQGQFQANEQQYAQDQRNAMKDARAANLQEVESSMTLDKMDPRSPVSKAAQESYAPLFQKLGYPAGKLNGMSAANIDATLQLMTAYGGKEVEAMIKQYELEAERMRIAASIANQNEQSNIEKERMKNNALGDLSKMPWYSRALHPGVSGALEEQAGLKEPAASTETAKEAPYGQTTTRNGVEYEWSPVTGKYHRKK